MIVSKSKFFLDVIKIKIPFAGSSNIVNRQFEADSFNKCALTINIIFFPDSIDFLPRKSFIFLICSILIISAELFF